MTIDWTGQDAARRIDALEREIASLREEIANQGPAEDPRVPPIATSLAELGHRLSTLEERVATSIQSVADQLEERVAASIQSVADQAERATASEERAETDRKDLTELRRTLLRLERRIYRHEEETGKIATGLLERIERLRVPRPETKAAVETPGD